MLNIPPLKDAEIRRYLHQWLLVSHPNGSDSGILHELKVPRPSARIDVALVNGEISGFEIKGDTDSLARLSRQAKAYAAICDRATIVTTRRHVCAAERFLPSWWGIISLDREMQFSTVRVARQNTFNSPEAMLYVLLKSELLAVCKICQIGKPSCKLSKELLVNYVLIGGDDTVIRSAIRHVLKKRRQDYSDDSLELDTIFAA